MGIDRYIMKMKREKSIVLIIIGLLFISFIMPLAMGNLMNINHFEDKDVTFVKHQPEKVINNEDNSYDELWKKTNRCIYLQNGIVSSRQWNNYQSYHKYEYFIYDDNNITNEIEHLDKREKLDNSSQMNEHDKVISAIQADEVQFYGQSNESIYVVKVSNPNEVILDQFSFEVTEEIIGKKSSSGAFIIRCSIFDESIGGGLYPLGAIGRNEFYNPGLLRYFHYEFGENINYTYENRTVYEYDNETFFTWHLYYPFCPVKIPSGTWYFVFSSIIYDLDQTDYSTEWSVWMNFSGNCSGLNLSTGEGGKIFKLWYRGCDANIIVSNVDVLELMLNGKASFHIENTFFYRYESYPMWRGFWKVKWITPDGIKKFNMIILRGHWIYDEDDWDGCIWGMGGSGDYELRTSYIDNGRRISGNGPTNFPTFVGLDVKLP